MEKHNNPNELTHYGVKGMKWGVIGGAAATAVALSKYKKKKKAQDQLAEKQNATLRKSISEMSDAELNARLNRLRLEKQYAELTAPSNERAQSKGKAFVSDVIAQSGKNIATQFTTYALGTAVNATAKAFAVKQPNESYGSVLKESYKRAFKSAFSAGNAVNAKKGQKDK